MVVDLRALDATTRTTAVGEIVRAAADRPFDIVNGPCLRAQLLQLGEGDYRLIVVLHHIASDGESIPVFLRELGHLYTARVMGSPPTLAAPPIQYRHFANWQRRLRTPEVLDAELSFWRDRLRDVPTLLRLPADRPREQSLNVVGSSISIDLGPEHGATPDSLEGAPPITAFHCLLAAFGILLARYTGQYDLVIGSPVAARKPVTENLIGPFLNILPLRLDFTSLATFDEALRCTQQAVLSALDHEDAPFEHIVNAVRPIRSAGSTPLFQVMLAFENAPVTGAALPGLEVETQFVADHTAKYDLTLIVHRHAGRLRATLRYRCDLFDRATIERMGAHYVQVLEQIRHGSQESFRLMPFGMAEEQAHLASFSRGEHRDYPLDRPVHTFFERQVELAPHSVALDFDGQSLSYGQLNRRANQLAHALLRKGVGPEVIVAICIERSLAMVIATLAVLKAGGGYAPIDPDYPIARRSFMAGNTQATIVLTRKAYGDAFSPDRTMLLDEDEWPFAGESERNPPLRVAACNACYVIHTSGSTGEPKAVVTAHAALCNNLLWMQDRWPLCDSDVVLQKSSYSFDVSVKEILWPLMVGARVQIARPGGHRDPEYLQDVMRSAKVTVTHLVPSMLEYVLQHDADALADLRILMCGGEALSGELKERFCRHSDAVLLHLYGPTEAAIAVTASTYGKGNVHEAVSLGRPMPNAQIYILDTDMQNAPIGVWGELCIGGTPLARGYLGAAELTAERFIPDSFGTESGGRLYRTGDIARWRADGSLEYRGRSDRQIKLRGLRIEPGEIEFALRGAGKFAQVAVAPRKLASGAICLIAYVVPDGVDCDLEALRRRLRDRLPVFMIPERFVVLKSLPLNANGKVDFESLPEPPDPNQGAAVRSTAGRTGLIRQLERAWLDVLGRESIGHDENFFDAGGHSFAVARLQRRVRELCDREIRLTDFFAYPTIASLAEHLEGESSAAASPLVSRTHKSDSGPCAIAVIGMAGRFPGANDLTQYWQNIFGAVESIRFFTDDELTRAGVPQALLNDPNYVRARGAIDAIDLFDAEFFGYSSREADALDPQLRLMLELSQHACDDAGYDPRAWRGRNVRCGVFACATRSTYFLNGLQQRVDVLKRLGPQTIAIGTDKSFLATQIAYRLDLVGPCVTIDTACSSSIVALHHACHALQNGEADVVMVAGASVDVPMVAGYVWEQGNISSRDGHCRPFDAAANGTIKGNGAAVVLLKRLDAALADGDSIRAVVRGTATNNDGAQKVSYTAPSESGQAAVISAAIERAGVARESIAYVEAHGTGTALGDPIEIAALARVFKHGELHISSVKANIGHLDAAAGLAGLVKTVLALEHRIIPPAANFTRMNPAADVPDNPVRLTQQPLHWPADRPHAGISSFGIGGTNAHAILEPAPSVIRATVERPELIQLSGVDADALRDAAAGWLERIQSRGSVLHGDIAFTLSDRRHAIGARRALVARSTAELRLQLTQLLSALDANRDAEIRHARRSPRVGVWSPGTLRISGHVIAALCEHDATFRSTLEECARTAEQLRGPIANEIRWEQLVREPANRQSDASGPLRTLATFAITLALARSLQARGIRSTAYAGRDVGDLALACAESRLTLQDAIARILSRETHDDFANRKPATDLESMSDTFAALASNCDIVVALCDATTLEAFTQMRHEVLPFPVVAMIGATDAAGSSDAGHYLHALGSLWEQGVELTWLDDASAHAPGSTGSAYYRRTPLPLTRFNRRRHWIDANFYAGPGWAVTAALTPSLRETRVPYWSRDEVGLSDREVRHWLLVGRERTECEAVAHALRERDCRVAIACHDENGEIGISSVEAWCNTQDSACGVVWIGASSATMEHTAGVQSLTRTLEGLNDARSLARVCVCTRAAFDIIGDDCQDGSAAIFHGIGEALVASRHAHANLDFLGVDLEDSPTGRARSVAQALMEAAPGVISERNGRWWRRNWSVLPISRRIGELTDSLLDLVHEAKPIPTPELSPVTNVHHTGVVFASPVMGDGDDSTTTGGGNGSARWAARASAHLVELKHWMRSVQRGIILVCDAHGARATVANRYFYERCRELVSTCAAGNQWYVVDLELEASQSRPRSGAYALAAEATTELMSSLRSAETWVARPGMEPQGPAGTPLSGSQQAARVRTIWCELLGLEARKTDDSSEFFAAGGTSLTAAQLVRGIEETCDVHVSLPAFFDTPTLGGLIELVLATPRPPPTAQHAALQDAEELEAVLI